MGSTAASLEDSHLEDIEKAKYQLISASSKILSKPFVSSFKKSDSPLHRHLCVIIMDESHTVETNRPQFFYVALCFIMFVFFVSTIVFSYLKRQPEAVIHEQDPCCMWLVLCQAAALHDGVAPEFGSYPAS